MREIIAWGAWGLLQLALLTSVSFCTYIAADNIRKREWGFVPVPVFLGLLAVLLFLQGFVVAGLAH